MIFTNILNFKYDIFGRGSRFTMVSITSTPHVFNLTKKHKIFRVTQAYKVK